jgi:hypothetical protein
MDNEALKAMVDQHRREAVATAKAAFANLEEAETTAKAIRRGISTKVE